MVTSVVIVLSVPMEIGNNRSDSLIQALEYTKRFRMSVVTGDDLSGNTDITSSRSFSCFSGLIAILYSIPPDALPVYEKLHYCILCLFPKNFLVIIINIVSIKILVFTVSTPAVSMSSTITWAVCSSIRKSFSNTLLSRISVLSVFS